MPGTQNFGPLDLPLMAQSTTCVHSLMTKVTTVKDLYTSDISPIAYNYLKNSSTMRTDLCNQRSDTHFSYGGNQSNNDIGLSIPAPPICGLLVKGNGGDYSSN